MKTQLILISISAGLAAANEVAPGARTTADPAPPATAQTLPTRFIGGEVDAYVVKLRERLAINRQERCPFGLYQVPGETPIVSSPITRLVKKTPFSDYIKQIQISIINSKDKEFFVGARVFRLGQVFPIVRGGEKLSVRVEAIESSKVSFKNLKTGEIAAKELSLLPAGLTADAELDIPGLIPEGSAGAAALILEPDSSPPRP